MNGTNDLSIDDINDVSLAETDGPRLYVQPNEPKSSNWLSWFLVAAIAFFAWNYYHNQVKPAPDDDKSVIIDEDDEQASPEPVIDTKGAWLVFVLENTTATADETLVLQGIDDDWGKSRGLKGVRRSDEEQEPGKSLVEYGIGRGVASPLMAIVRDKTPIKVSPFPKTKAEIEAFIK